MTYGELNFRCSEYRSGILGKTGLIVGNSEQESDTAKPAWVAGFTVLSMVFRSQSEMLRRQVLYPPELRAPRKEHGAPVGHRAFSSRERNNAFRVLAGGPNKLRDPGRESTNTLSHLGLCEKKEEPMI